eukprot:7552691-Pyramimonas_sp.AAC.1
MVSCGSWGSLMGAMGQPSPWSACSKHAQTTSLPLPSGANDLASYASVNIAKRVPATNPAL